MSGIYQLALFDASPGTVLVVDDDAQVRGLLVALLRPRGYQVETAASAEEAQERLKTLRPDVLLLDLHLPGKSGQDVLAHLRADPVTRLLPIIMITGGATGEERLRAMAEGVTDFVAKPFAAAERLAGLHSLVQMKRLTGASGGGCVAGCYSTTSGISRSETPCSSSPLASPPRNSPRSAGIRSWVAS